MQRHNHQDLGWWWESEDYGDEIKKIRAISEGFRAVQLPEQIPLSTAKRIFTDVLQAAGEFTHEVEVETGKTGNIFVHEQIAARGFSVMHDVQKMNSKLIPIIHKAMDEGASMVPSGQFKYQAILITSSIAASYEALAEIHDAKPWFLRGAGVDAVIKSLVSAGRAVQFVAAYTVDPLKNALDAADDTMAKMITVLKWSSVAGGLFLLYRAIEPKKGK